MVERKGTVGKIPCQTGPVLSTFQPHFQWNNVDVSLNMRNVNAENNFLHVNTAVDDRVASFSFDKIFCQRNKLILNHFEFNRNGQKERYVQTASRTG